MWTIAILLLSAALSTPQSTNASIAGNVTDSSGQAVPNVTITAENTGTGILLTTLSNETGVYTFPSVQPGTYRLSAELAGFRKNVYENVTVNVSARLNLNFALEVAGVTQEVQVTAAADSPLLAVTASVGGVITGEEIRDLPLPDRDALGLVLTQPGVIGSNFGGARIEALNVTRDGINVMDQRIDSGVNSVITPNTDLIEEVRVITAPVDAQFGAGSGQVQMITKSGTNEFHGTISESNRNTSLTANSFFNNLNGIPRDDLIRNQFGGAIGGPIRKNKTFFYFLYDAQRQVTRDRITSTVFTNQARQGNFRFFPGVLNGNADAAVPTVDLLGNPVTPPGATGPLQSFNVYGRDPNRLAPDPSGTIQRFMASMPEPNNYRFGDGLNTAGYTWRRRDTADSDQANIKFDHLLSERHRLSVSYSYENARGINGFMGQQYPTLPGGKFTSSASFYALNLVSTISPSILNEFRAGAQRARYRFHAPWELEGNTSVLPKTPRGASYLPVFGLVTPPIATDSDPQGRISPLYQYADTLNWQRERHAIKMGGDVRFRSSNGFNSFDVMPRAYLGAGGIAVANINARSIPGLGANTAPAQGLLIDLTGSLSGVSEAFNSSGPPNLAYQAGIGKQRTWRQREFSFFFQDDYKVKPNLTLNLGLRYEYFGVPWEANGKAAALVNGSSALFGLSGTSWNDLYAPGHIGGALTEVQLVGKNSPNPNAQIYNDDWNNFAPVIGLSWGLPWFGKDKTVLRAGYSVSYERNGLRLIDVASGDEPGLNLDYFFTSGQYLDLTRLQLPFTITDKPLDTVPLNERFRGAYSFDTNLRTPYVQNWNVSIERELPASSTLTMRYVGSKGTKLLRSVNINESNIFENGILDAFITTQRGGNAPLFDRMFRGLDLGLGRINGTSVTASASLRNNDNTYFYFADNNVGAFANYLNTTSDFTGERGGLLRNGGFPENSVVGNPQFLSANLVANLSNSTYHSMQLEWNKRLSHGLIFDSNYTFSKTIGDEEGDTEFLENTLRNGRDRQLDRRPLTFGVGHVFRNSGTYEVPFGHFQIGTILNFFSGHPISFYTSVSSFNQNPDQPDLVANVPKGTGNVVKGPKGVSYFTGLHQVPDPAIPGLTSQQQLNEYSSLFAIADSSGKLVAVNPTPGKNGNMAYGYLSGPGSFRFDMDIIKRFRIRESLQLELRADAINVLNKPIWGDPDSDINSTDFGRITTSGPGRIIVLGGRINF
jgi:carboxypeptidase family protein/TonB-dependent receptor-like protein